MKTRLVHIDCITSAFEEYLKGQLIPADLIPAEIRDFQKILAKKIVHGRFSEKKEEK